MLLLIRHVEPDGGRQYCDYFGSAQTPAVRNTLLDVTEVHYTKVRTSADKWKEDIENVNKQQVFLPEHASSWDGWTISFNGIDPKDYEWFELLLVWYKRRGSTILEAQVEANAQLWERNEKTLADQIVLHARLGPLCAL